jgi:acetyltransferase-like isoleucine patch superfamily enzyme
MTVGSVRRPRSGRRPPPPRRVSRGRAEHPTLDMSRSIHHEAPMMTWQPGQMPSPISVLSQGLFARVRDVASRFRVAYQFRDCTRVGPRPDVLGRLWVHGGGRVVFGQRVRLDASCAPIEIHSFAGAEIELGDDVVIQGGASIEAMRSIRIGAGCRVGMHCKIIDGHFHAMDGHRGGLVPAGQVVLEAGVVLAPNSIVVAGHLGEATVVAARAVVTRRVRPNAVIRGFPATTESRRSP